MGIDIYAKWRGQTKAEEKAQITGFSVVHGHVGYLREAYHGEPYATRYLFKECFAGDPDGVVDIPARVLRERLPAALELVRERYTTIYYESSKDEINEVVRSFVNFVELCEQKEKETGVSVTIIASF